MHGIGYIQIAIQALIVSYLRLSLFIGFMALSVRHILSFSTIFVIIVFQAIYYQYLEFPYFSAVKYGINNIFGYSLHSTLFTKTLFSMLLKIQEKQMYRSIHASFVPETHDQFLTIKMRFGELVKKHVHGGHYNNSRLHYFNLILRYYEATDQNTTGNEILNVTFSLRIELESRLHTVTLGEQLKSIFIMNATSMDNNKKLTLTGMVPSPDKDVINEEITVPARFLIYNSYTYRFALELIQPIVNYTHKVPLTWPDWPLSTTCLMEIMKDIRKKNKSHRLFNVTPLDYSCTEAKFLVISNTYSSFVRERTAIIHWLDMMNEANDISSRTSTSSQIKKTMNDEVTVFPTYRRPVPFEKSLKISVCPTKFQTWIADYQKWHSNVSRALMQLELNYTAIKDYILGNNIRFLLYHNAPVGHGVTDRTLHLISTYMTAILTRRFLAIDHSWPELERVYILSLNVLQNIVIPWLPELLRFNQVGNLTSSNTSYISAKTYKFQTERFAQDYNYDVQLPERIVTIDSFVGNVVHTISSKTSIYSNFLKNDLQMTSENLFGCLYHSFLIPRLESLIQMTLENNVDKNENHQLGYTYGKMLQILLSFKFHPIGVQIRVGDLSFLNVSQLDKDPSSDRSLLQKYHKYFSCADELGNSYYRKNLNSSSTNVSQLVVVYLMSDNRQLRQAALRQWQLPYLCLNQTLQSCTMSGRSQALITTTNRLEHIANTENIIHALQHTMIETFLFSICQEHIFSLASGFGRMPAFAALNFRNIYSFSERDHVSCSDQGGIKLEVSAHHQSGI